MRRGSWSLRHPRSYSCYGSRNLALGVRRSAQSGLKPLREFKSSAKQSGSSPTCQIADVRQFAYAWDI